MFQSKVNDLSTSVTHQLYGLFSDPLCFLHVVLLVFTYQREKVRRQILRMVQNNWNDSEEVAVPPHPLGVKPLGNAYTAKQNIKLAAGYFSHVPDEIIIEILEWLDSHALVELEKTCKALYAFCHHDEIWRSLFIL